jgi:hypothetical protein
VLRSAGRQLPDRPEAVALQNDLSNTFRQLFLQGLADGMQPIQAVGLFYDFQDLTPIGADGDQMVRNLVRRLVDVDLLDDAGKLLKYQVDNRLNGVPKAQVATDLAWIYLMNKQARGRAGHHQRHPHTILPPALNAERRLATARALMGLGRYDAALELIDKDNSRDGQEIRAEIAWKQHTWPAAGSLYERSLGDRFKTPGRAERPATRRACCARRRLQPGRRRRLAGPPARALVGLHRHGRQSRRPARGVAGHERRIAVGARTSAASPPTTRPSTAGSAG